MVLLFSSFRKTVAPGTGAEFPSRTVPDTVRMPIFWARAAEDRNAFRGPAEGAPNARRLSSVAASTPARLILTPPRPVRRDHLPLRCLLPRAPVPAVLPQPPHTPSHTHRRLSRRPLPLRQFRCSGRCRIQGSSPLQPPHFLNRIALRDMNPPPSFGNHR